MYRDLEVVIAQLGPSNLDVAEVSGDLWASYPWRSRFQLNFPAFDLCDPPPEVPGPFDLVICEQVLEHVVNPLRAVRTLREMCKHGGHVYVSTPFLVRIHDHPGDYWRFTPDGMRLLLESQGLRPLWVRSWGNRRAVQANFDHWRERGRRGTLRNEAHLPAVVWALATPARVRRS
jgi:SAM-dependent methyltransferase